MKHLRVRSFEIKDELAVGPLKDIDTEEGWKARQEWWRDVTERFTLWRKHSGKF